jgi:SAM-dependent methyltransferase
MDEALLLRFEELEEEHWWFVIRRRLVLEWAARYAPDPLARLLEVGCGTGGNLKALGKHFNTAELRGVEPVPSAVAVSRSRGCEVTLGGFEHLPAEDSSIDMLITLDVIEHLEDDLAGLKEVRRVLRPGGRLLLTVPALPFLWSPHDEANAHLRRYTRKTLVEVVERAGLAIERVSYFNALLMPLGVMVRAMASLLRFTRTPGVDLPPRPVNALMRAIFGLEVPLLRHLDLPVGMSLALVATRPVSEWLAGSSPEEDPAPLR